MDLRGMRVAAARFPAGLHLPPHYHETACLTVMLTGTLRERMDRRSVECSAGHVLLKPWGERHDDTFGAGGTRQVIVELPANPGDDLPEMQQLFGTVTLERDPASAALARRIADEFRRPDAASALAVEALALELLVGLLRRRAGDDRRSPPWLLRARDRILADLWTEHSTRALAAEANVHPGYFARAFRRHFGRSVGAFLRHARLEWAAHQLRASHRSLSELAHQARFADHSHFTREFKRQYGVPPREYRRRHS